MLSVHLLIGVGEALITIAALSFIATTAPDLLGEESATHHSLLRRATAGAGVTVAVIALATLFASTDPDGLNSVAQALGFSNFEAGTSFNLFAGYAIPGLDGTASTVAAALIGAAAIAGLLFGLSRLAASRSVKR
jgi:cobalt/nickel transport system permease protein